MVVLHVKGTVADMSTAECCIVVSLQAGLVCCRFWVFISAHSQLCRDLICTAAHDVLNQLLQLLGVADCMLQHAAGLQGWLDDAAMHVHVPFFLDELLHWATNTRPKACPLCLSVVSYFMNHPCTCPNGQLASCCLSVHGGQPRYTS
jgi:hypothetical protein